VKFMEGERYNIFRRIYSQRPKILNSPYFQQRLLNDLKAVDSFTYSAAINNRNVTLIKMQAEGCNFIY
jgi:hypothetical protein